MHGKKAADAPHTVDVVYRRIAAEKCSLGLKGSICREKLKLKLCKERWTDSNVPGMSVCRLTHRPGPLS